MTIEGTKAQIQTLNEIAEGLFNQLWESLDMPKEMKNHLHDHVYNDFTTPTMRDWLTDKSSLEE